MDNIDDELTPDEIRNLIAKLDSLALDQDNFDKEFYLSIANMEPIYPEDTDDGIRRAIIRFANEVIETEDEQSATYARAGFTMGFVYGYKLGQKLDRDITKKQRRGNR